LPIELAILLTPHVAVGSVALVGDQQQHQLLLLIMECIEMIEDFIRNNPELWNEDIGI